MCYCMCMQEAVSPHIWGHVRATQMNDDDEGAFWREMLTPGSQFNTEIDMLWGGEQARWREYRRLNIEYMPVMFYRHTRSDYGRGWGPYNSASTVGEFRRQ